MFIHGGPIVAGIVLGLTMQAGAVPSGHGMQKQQDSSQTEATTSTSAPQPGHPGCTRDNTTPPKVLSAPAPKFPRAAKKKPFQGVSVVGLIVDEAGRPQHVHIVKSIADNMSTELVPAAQELDQEALKAVEHYKFAPAKCKGAPVPVEVNVQVNFLIH